MGKEPYVSTLKKWGWKGEDYSKDSIRIKESYRPVYSDAEAENLGRWWSHNDDHVKSRKDGWATYFRFYAWLARQYDRVLITDLDVFFTENPDPHVVEIPANVTFLASLEMKTHRKFGFKVRNRPRRVVHLATRGLEQPHDGHHPFQCHFPRASAASPAWGVYPLAEHRRGRARIHLSAETDNHEGHIQEDRPT